MIPVILIHKGNSSYLYNTFFQLNKTNPSVKAYLIGTSESIVYEPLVDHVKINAFKDEADSFENSYKHFSTNSKEFELVCIQRWFVLKAFMIQNNIQRCLYLDSDVLIYEDIQVLAQKYSHAGMTLCGISGHTNFVDKDVLIDFCNFIWSVYKSPTADRDLEKYYQTFIAQHGAGGVSDMTLLTWYAAANSGKVTNIYYTAGQTTFDPAFEVGGEYFVMNNEGKDIVFDNNVPYGILKETNQKVRFNTLHFQGAKPKRIMRTFIPAKNMLFYWNEVYYKLILLFQKGLKKVRL